MKGSPSAIPRSRLDGGYCGVRYLQATGHVPGVRMVGTMVNTSLAVGFPSACRCRLREPHKILARMALRMDDTPRPLVL